MIYCNSWQAIAKTKVSPHHLWGWEIVSTLRDSAEVIRRIGPRVQSTTILVPAETWSGKWLLPSGCMSSVYNCLWVFCLVSTEAIWIATFWNSQLQAKWSRCKMFFRQVKLVGLEVLGSGLFQTYLHACNLQTRMLKRALYPGPGRLMNRNHTQYWQQVLLTCSCQAQAERAPWSLLELSKIYSAKVSWFCSGNKSNSDTWWMWQLWQRCRWLGDSTVRRSASGSRWDGHSNWQQLTARHVESCRSEARGLCPKSREFALKLAVLYSTLPCFLPMW